MSALSRPARPRERVLAAAAELFYANGVEGVGVDAISERSRVSKSTLYRHFPTKAHLIAAYLQEGHERRLVEWKEAIAAANGDPRDRLLSVFDWLAQWFESREFRGCRFINAAVQIQDPHHPAYAIPRHHKEEVSRLFFELGREAGAADPSRLASELSLLVDGAVIRALLEGDSGAASRAKELATLALQAAGLKPAITAP